jgi:hypothetical protein
MATVFLWSAPQSPWQNRLLHWDANYYMWIVQHGYPTTLAPPSDSFMAFFPGYPLVVRLFEAVSGRPLGFSMVAVTVAAATVATVMIAKMVLLVTDRPVAFRTAIMWQLLPQSYLLCFGYSEALFVAVAASALYFTLKKAWIWAGIFAALSGLVRPTGLAFVVVGVVALLSSLRRDRSWKPWPLLVLAPLGALSYLIYLWRHTGKLNAWLTASSNWGDHEDLGRATFRFVKAQILHPSQFPVASITVAMMVVAFCLLVTMFLTKLPPTLIAYTTTVLFIGTTSGLSVTGAFPRTALLAFPALIPLSTLLDRLPVPARWLLGLASLAAACLFAGFVFSTLSITP